MHKLHVAYKPRPSHLYEIHIIRFTPLYTTLLQVILSYIAVDIFREVHDDRYKYANYGTMRGS
jgi:hypothetical protein